MLFNFILAISYNDADSAGFNLRTILLVAGIVLVFGILFFISTSKIDLRQEVPLVKDRARNIEKQAIQSMGEKEFARLLTDFEKEADGAYEKALYTMAASNDPVTTQVGICWLDRKGYGDLTLRQVQASLDSLRINNR